MSVLPFRQPSARTSPQRDPVRVAVNVTSIRRDAGRDMFKEARIRVLERLIVAASLADDMATARHAEADLAAIKGGLLRASKAHTEAR